MIKWIKGETLKVNGNISLRISLLLPFLFMIFITFDPFPYMELQIPSYFSSTFLLSLTIFGIIPCIVLGALLAYGEVDSNTLHLLINSVGRIRLFYYKTIFIFLASFLLILVTTLFGIAVHLFVGAPGQIFNMETLGQIFIVSIICFCWGELAFIFSLITKNLMYSVIILFMISYFEPILYPYINENMLKYLMVFNQKAILSPFFPNLIEGSYIIVPDLDFPSIMWSSVYLFVLIAGIILLGDQYIRKCSIIS
ncbi:hypothetical protein MUB24_12650 [Lederbergia sp. NSJ-179]|uniref:hypothetical protein n=1 Tax=Lederbergia sp. NSJ-179 TaxID=2931402 RepID=UPI001FD33CB4|nr:hypothetical protein [Lederbergia sp. NSJ-179]MCJ7841731.1 hypothetical protein [Lederbergia sp. NSJ-179]